MSFTKRFDDESKNLRKNLKQAFKRQNQKIDLIKIVKEVFTNLMTNEIKQIERILLKVIEMLKTNLKKKTSKTRRN